MELITQAEFARRMGVSQEAVRKAVKKGRITLVRGKVNPARAVDQWAKNTDPYHGGKRTKGKPVSPLASSRKNHAGAVAPATTVLTDSPPPNGNGAAPDPGRPEPPEDPYTKARIEREIWKSRAAELEYMKKAGALVDAESVRTAAAEAAQAAKRALLQIPDRMASHLSPAADRRLREEIAAVCEKLSRPPGKNGSK